MIRLFQKMTKSINQFFLNPESILVSVNWRMVEGVIKSNWPSDGYILEVRISRMRILIYHSSIRVAHFHLLRINLMVNDRLWFLELHLERCFDMLKSLDFSIMLPYFFINHCLKLESFLLDCLGFEPELIFLDFFYFCF